MKKDLADYLIRIGDSNIILGQQLCQWCGHGPMLEEDIALSNIALDCFGQGSLWLQYACILGGGKTTPDELVYWRDDRGFKNYLITELPRGDFAFTIARQFLFDVFLFHLYEALVNTSSDSEVRAIAQKGIKEVAYHLRHSREWMIRLGNGTEESNQRLQEAVNTLFPYVPELYKTFDKDEALAAKGLIVLSTDFEAKSQQMIEEIISRSSITCPEVVYPQLGGPEGFHTEHLGHILAEMQSLARAHPGATW